MTEGAITLEQLVDIVNQDLTVSGLFPKLLPDQEIKRIVKEHALEWFYKNYMFAVQRFYYYLNKENMEKEQFTNNRYFIMPEEIENIVDIKMINDTSLFKMGVSAPHLSINMGVTNQPYLTSFVSTAGDLAIYKSTVSAFADEINKMVLESVKFDYNPVNKRLVFLGAVNKNLLLETNVRVEQEEMFDLQLFKDYVIGKSRVRLSDVVSRFTNLELPGGFQYDAASLKTSGDDMIKEVTESVKGIVQTGWFFMSR